MVGLQLLSQDWFVGGSAIRSRYYRDAKPRSPCWPTGGPPPNQQLTPSSWLASFIHSNDKLSCRCSGHSWKSPIRWPNPALFHPTAALFFSDLFSPLNCRLDSSLSFDIVLQHDPLIAHSKPISCILSLVNHPHSASSFRQHHHSSIFPTIRSTGRDGWRCN